MKATPRGVFLDISVDTPDGEKTYPVPAVGIEVGLQLNAYLADPEKANRPAIEIAKLVLGDVWGQLVTDGVPLSDALSIGTACLLREQMLMTVSGPDRWTAANEAAAAFVDGRPELLAPAQGATGGSTKPTTRTGEATTTQRRVSGSGTPKKKPTSSTTASRSRGRGSRTTGS